MSQNRKAPAYQEYAADTLAKLSFRTEMASLDWTIFPVS